MGGQPRSRLRELLDTTPEVEDCEAASDASDPRLARAFNYFDELARDVRRSVLLEIEAEAGEGLRFGAYRALRVLGRGGMGTVFLAARDDGAFDQRVALKVLHVGEDRDEVVARFLAERRILSRLEHPGLARLIDGGSDAHGRPYLVMEYVDGVPIVQYCRDHRLAIPARLALVRAVIDVVAYAHRNLVVHRDLKPSNIFVDASGRVKLLDFGIAKVMGDASGETRTEGAPMTVEYAAPEQLRGGAITTLTDVYGLGGILYELLCGQRPFVRGDETLGQFESRVLTEPPRSPSQVARHSVAGGDPALARRLRGDLDTICLTALQKDPARRYQSAAELGDDLDRHRHDRPLKARPESRWQRARRYARRHRGPIGTVAAIVLGSAATTVTMALQARAVARERDRAQQVTNLLLDVFTVADPAQGNGEHVTAREVVTRGVARVEQELGGRPDLQVDMLEVLGRVYRNMGLYGQSAALLERAVMMRRQAGNAGALVEAVHWLGLARHDRGDYEAAESTFREALRVADDLDPVSTRRLRASTYLGLALLRQNKLDEAQPHLDGAVTLARASSDVPALDVADALTGLGILRLARGAFADAEPVLREALELRRSTLHPAHVLIAETENNLASALGQLGRHSEAEGLQRQAIGRLREGLGNSHPRVATGLNNLALVIMGQQRAAEAEPLFREANAIRRAALGPQHPDLAQGLSNLGLLLLNTGRADEATPLLAEALAIRRAAFGEQHVAVAQSLNNVALLEQARGDLAGAEARLREALGILRAVLGGQHPLIAINANNLALVISSAHPGEAEALFREAVAIRKRVLPAGHPHTAYALLGLGEHLVTRGRAGDAEPVLLEALAMRQARTPLVPWEVAEVENALGECLSMGANRAGGLARVSASWATLRDTAPPSVRLKARDRLVRLGMPVN